MSVNPPGELPPDPLPPPPQPPTPPPLPPDPLPISPPDPGGVGPPHSAMRGGGEPEGPVEPGLGPPHMRRHQPHGHPHPEGPIEPGLGPPHAEMPDPPEPAEPPEPPIPPPPPPGPEPIPREPEPGAPVEPGLGPPHMRQPHTPEHHGHGEHHPHEGEPHAPIEPGLGPPHAEQPHNPEHHGHGESHLHEGEPHAPIEPGLGPPHAELPPLPPRPGEQSGAGGSGSPPPREPDRYTPPEPPALPPWLRAEPIGGTANAALGGEGVAGDASGGETTAGGPAGTTLSAAAEAGAAGDMPLFAAAAAAEAPGEFAPPGSPGRAAGGYPEPFTPPAAAPTAGSEASLLTPAAVTPAEPTTARASAAPPRRFGEAMATGVLLTLAGGSAAVGGILALYLTEAFEFPVKAGISGGVAVALLVGAVALRLVRNSDDLRGLLAVLGITFAAASMTFAYDPADATDHDNLVKFALVAGVVTLLSWFTAIVVPSAVAGFLAAVALGTAAGLGVFLALESPTRVEVYVAALGVGVALAALLPRITALRPHPLGLGWALAGAALVITVPAVELIARGDATALAAGATASAALLALAARHRHLPAALGALAGLAAVEGFLVTNYVSLSESGGVDTTRLVVVAIAGGVLIALVAAGVLVTARGRALPRWPLPVGPADILLAASLALAVVSLFTGPGDTPLRIDIPQFSTSSSATHLLPATPQLALA